MKSIAGENSRENSVRRNEDCAGAWVQRTELSSFAEDVGIRAASIYYYFPGKADLAAAVAKRYWENAAAALETLLAESSDPVSALRRYPETFRWALENDNRMCLSGFMAAEYADIPDTGRKRSRPLPTSMWHG